MGPEELSENCRPGTQVFAIMRKATPEGVHPYEGEVLEVRDLGHNVLTEKGRHIMAAKMAGGKAGGSAQLPAGNTYAEGDGWYIEYMSLGANDSPGTSPDSTNTVLDNEDSTSLKALTSAAEGDKNGNPFTGLGDTGLSYYTHVAWKCLYTSGEANGDIRELGLWIADGTSDPSGDVPAVSPTRGPLVSRKVLSGLIEKTTDISLEFIWVYIY